uniref:Phosphatidate cytidylyltransferase, mitochondrial n=1 Tax=Globisporangium ultimum (strain ATCC 200006 / CBS 805.95 / DAOM BR144) TaxID=431595 RepID=K3WSQ8_GLOUD
MAAERPLAASLDRALRDSFPPMQFSMAYGSGVFAQRNHDASTSLLDLVFAVDDPVAWHTANLARNAGHYSFLQYLGAERVADFQEHYGAGIYYNTLVPLQSKATGNRLIKYGVVSSKTLCDDLTNWKTLYLSGRMHKPVHILSSNEQINSASSINLSHALHYALLCLPEKFSETELFMRTAGISYLGDFRMTFGENPKKVRNIVDGNLDAFRQLYENKIKNSPFLDRSIADSSMLVANTLDHSVHRTLLESMPSNVLRKMQKSKSFDVTITDRKATKKHVQRAVASIVNRYSRTQSIKGIATAGAVKTVQYVAQKLQRTYFKR